MKYWIYQQYGDLDISMQSIWTACTCFDPKKKKRIEKTPIGFCLIDRRKKKTVSAETQIYNFDVEIW